MAIEANNSDYGSQNSIEIITPVIPKNVLLSPSTRNNADTEKNMPGNVESNEVDDLFDYDNHEKCLPAGKNFIDHVFDKFDDLQAKFVKKDESPINKLANQVKCLASLEYTPKQNRRIIDTEEAKSRRLLAASEGRKAFCEILENVGINSDAYIADVFSSKKKKRPEKFECSTPIASSSQTPISKRIATPLPLSGIRFLGSPINISNSNNELSSYMTPVSRSDILPDTDVSEVTENMKTILMGITCFVDARTGRDNCSESCKKELMKIGAKIEKNFTKKVTHVVFKEGKKSTYTKAKNLGIPIVSVVWIEACKIAKGPVDPSLYPPANLDKYEVETPVSVILERKLKRLLGGKGGTKALNGGSLRLTPTHTRSTKKECNKRKALTEMKDNSKDKATHSNKGRHCTKKLNFINADEPEVLDDKEDKSIIVLDNSLNNSDTENLSESSELAKLKLNSLPKRKSAPGALAKKKAKNVKKLDDYFKNDNNLNTSKKRERSESPENIKQSPIKSETNFENLNNDDMNIKKKRKLYVPDTSVILKEIQPETIAAAVTPVSTVKTLAPSVRKELNTKILDLSDDTFANTRGSISFLERTNHNRKPKPIPTIVFTSIHREDCEKLTVIVKKLGTFDVEDQVSERTSHVVTNSLRRTLNLLRGLARGCWIVRDQWINESDSTGKWLAEEHFELKSYSPAVTECRLEKQVFKKSFRMDLFSKFGPIYVSQQTSPASHELIDLIKLCGGKIASCARGAQLIVGKKVVSDKSILNVHEKWILDSIFNNKSLNIDNYIILQDNNNANKLKKDANVIKRIEIK